MESPTSEKIPNSAQKIDRHLTEVLDESQNASRREFMRDLLVVAGITSFGAGGFASLQTYKLHVAEKKLDRVTKERDLLQRENDMRRSTPAPAPKPTDPLPPPSSEPVS